jgi:hypothetical protein
VTVEAVAILTSSMCLYMEENCKHIRGRGPAIFQDYAVFGVLTYRALNNSSNSP